MLKLFIRIRQCLAGALAQAQTLAGNRILQQAMDDNSAAQWPADHKAWAQLFHFPIPVVPGFDRRNILALYFGLGCGGRNFMPVFCQPTTRSSTGVMQPALRYLLLFIPLLLSGSLFAQSIIIPPGSAIESGPGALHLACGELAVAGMASGNFGEIADVSLQGNAVLGGEVKFSGNWTSSSAGNDVAGIVRWVDGCDRLTGQFQGSAQLGTLEVISSTGRLVSLSPSETRLVSTSMVLQGTVDEPLRLRSTQAGVRAPLALQASASQTIQFVDVADLDATAGIVLAPGAPVDFQSVDSGNNLGWFMGLSAELPIPVNSLRLPGMLFLVLLMALFAFHFAVIQRK